MYGWAAAYARTVVLCKSRCFMQERLLYASVNAYKGRLLRQVRAASLLRERYYSD